MSGPRLVCCAVASLVVLAACTNAPQGPTSPVLASGDGVRITADDLKARANLEAPLTRGALTDPAKKREYLDRMVDQEVLVAEARRQGLDKDPDYQATVKQMLLQRLMSHRLQKEAAWAPSMAELAAEYEKQKGNYPVPERVRVQVVAVQGEANSKPLLERLKKLEAARAEALKKGNGAVSEEEFTALGKAVNAEINSLDATARSKEELAAWLGQTLSAAAVTLPAVGAVSELLDAPKGKAMVRLAERQPAGFVPFEQVQGPLTMALAQAHQQQVVESFAKELKAKAPVAVDAKALDATDVTAPPVQPRPSAKP